MSTFGKGHGGGRRGARREHLPLIAVFTTRTRSHNGELVDLSATGARLRGDDLPEQNEDLILNIEGVATYGIVKWRRLGFCGIEFDAPMPLAQIKSLEQKVCAARGICLDFKAAMEDWTLGVAR